MAPNKATNFNLGKNGKLRFKGIMYVPARSELRQELFNEAHQGPLSLHLGSIKMYHDLISLSWWPGMNNEISEYVSSCLTCQHVKAEHQVPSEKLYHLEIPD